MWKNSNYRRWFWQGTIGILLLGSGLCMFAEAAFYKHTHPPMWKWVSLGTFTLIIVMSGLILMVDSVRYRIRYENDQMKEYR